MINEDFIGWRREVKWVHGENEVKFLKTVAILLLKITFTFLVYSPAHMRLTILRAAFRRVANFEVNTCLGVPAIFPSCRRLYLRPIPSAYMETPVRRSLLAGTITSSYEIPSVMTINTFFRPGWERGLNRYRVALLIAKPVRVPPLIYGIFWTAFMTPRLV